MPLAFPPQIPSQMNTSGNAPIIAAPGFSSGVASQLSDLTRDYMCYIQVGTGGGTVTLSIGATSAGTDVTLINAGVGVNGETFSIRLPAAWYLKITLVTSTITSQKAVGC